MRADLHFFFFFKVQTGIDLSKIFPMHASIKSQHASSHAGFNQLLNEYEMQRVTVGHTPAAKRRKHKNAAVLSAIA